MARVRATWKFVRESKFPALVAMAKEAGLSDPDAWHLTDDDVPILVAGSWQRFCQWSTARECVDYLQAWIDALAVVAGDRA